MRIESNNSIIVPKIIIITIMRTRERTRPAIAIPRGALNKPIMENTRPKNQRTKSIKGIQQKTSPNNAIINPAVPMLFECPPSTTTVVVLVETLGAATG